MHITNCNMHERLSVWSKYKSLLKIFYQKSHERYSLWREAQIRLGVVSYLLFSILVCSLSGRFLTRPTRQLALHSDFLRYIVLQTLIYIIQRETTCFPSSMLPRPLKSSKQLTDWSIYILAWRHQRKLCHLMLLASVIQWSV